VRIWSYELLPDSGGAGKYRGALGIARDVEVLTDGVVFSRYGDRQKNPVPGGNGGGAGNPGRFILNPGKHQQPLKSKGVDQLRKGDVVRVETPGGGGYGAAAKRSEKALASDLRDGKVTKKFIAEHFGEQKLQTVSRLIKTPRDAAD
jgi:N-methylhydantoinase B